MGSSPIFCTTDTLIVRLFILVELILFSLYKFHYTVNLLLALLYAWPSAIRPAFVSA